jgi:hypothetical protein
MRRNTDTVNQLLTLVIAFLTEAVSKGNQDHRKARVLPPTPVTVYPTVVVFDV